MNIPDRLIQKAIRDLKLQQEQRLEKRQRIKSYWRITCGFGLTLITAIAFWTAATYNHLTTSKIELETTKRQVENQLQRRADLIPQLINLTKTYGNREHKIVDQLIQARQLYLDADIFAEEIAAIAELDRAIASFANYATTNQPLNSSQLFINLQYEITGTENRLAVERRRHNLAVQEYNQEIQQFPGSLVAKTFEFKRL